MTASGEIAPGTPVDRDEPVISLSTRQRQLVRLIALGFSSEEAASELGISPRTARMHADVLRVKLGAAKRRQIPARYKALTGLDAMSADAGVEKPPNSRR